MYSFHILSKIPKFHRSIKKGDRTKFIFNVKKNNKYNHNMARTATEFKGG